ncbi:mRNA-decapping enzyme 1A [Gouania willdenowi]|uniref:5'-(N(7)-methylguanosine 5'-triphospho)-[mRNA] hydrolase n=1 Tax=Gouania willdenowi TaxID=441366 RepID=A0A8C5D6J3_GOUWI|nr:mRNA-decapping enzyme 1A [Gouania willdenowi]
MESAAAGHMMSLAALQRQDPYINKLLDVTGQVALYNFNSKGNEWEKTDIEGTLFVYERSASPHHGFTIMNRLSTENLVEPINKDLEFQLQDPFLLYRNGNLGIYSIWFYDKKDCQRIAQLMLKIVKHEADHAQIRSLERSELGTINGVVEPRSIDILELLSKAKDEYQRSQSGETNMLSEPNVRTSISSTEHRHHTLQPQKSFHTVVKQITVEELFGSSLPKDSSLPAMPAHPAHPTHSTPTTAVPSSTYVHSRLFSAQAHQSQLFPPHHAVKDSAALLQGPAPYPIHHGVPVYQPLCPAPSAPHMGQEVISVLIQGASPKPILAPNFLPNALVPPHSFNEPMGKVPLQHSSKEGEPLHQPPNIIKTLSSVPVSPRLPAPPAPPAHGPGEVSVLLSPSVFQQSINKVPSVVPPHVSTEATPTCGAALEPPSASCSKAQLQETLIYLIKNDADFLSTIHEAYLQTLSLDFNNMKL